MRVAWGVGRKLVVPEDNSVRRERWPACWARSGVTSDRGDPVDLDVPYRIVVLSANHLLVLEHGRIHRAERLEARLQDTGAATVAADFSAKKKDRKI